MTTRVSLPACAAAFLCACGSSSTDFMPGSEPDGGSNAPGMESGTTEASAHNDGSSASPTDGSPPSDAAQAGNADSATTGPSADAGTHPYKGVANSSCSDQALLRTSWYYNWGLTSNGCTSSIEFVPMIWGNPGAEQTASGITKEINGLVTAGFKTVLGFNEPDYATQSNIPVSTAIALWPSFNNPALRLGSPAVSTAGVSWFTTFMNAVNSDTTGTMRVDFIAMHWYGVNSGDCDSAATHMETYLKTIEAIVGNRPIWITEFGCLPAAATSTSVVQAFFSGAMTMLGNHPRVERHAWFPRMTNDGLVTNGALTPLGQIFQAAPSYK